MTYRSIICDCQGLFCLKGDFLMFCTADLDDLKLITDEGLIFTNNLLFRGLKALFIKTFPLQDFA